jgi:hypothetical protein
MENSDLQIGTKLKVNAIPECYNYQGVILEIDIQPTYSLYRIQWAEGKKKQDPIWVDLDYMRKVYTIAA